MMWQGYENEVIKVGQNYPLYLTVWTLQLPLILEISTLDVAMTHWCPYRECY